MLRVELCEVPVSTSRSLPIQPTACCARLGMASSRESEGGDHGLSKAGAQVRWRTPLVAATYRQKPVTEEALAPAAAAQDPRRNTLAPAAPCAASDAPGTPAEPFLAPAEGGAEAATRQLAALGQELAAAQLVRSKVSETRLSRVAGCCLPHTPAQRSACTPAALSPSWLLRSWCAAGTVLCSLH